MKGLLIKDFKLLKLQKNFFIVIVAIAIGLAITNDDPTFMLGYLTFIMSLFTLSTISYDEFDNGNTFLFTLPISRKSYVTEKYSFSLLIGSSSWILAVLLAGAFSLIKGTVPILEIIMTAIMMFPIMLIVYAVMIPFQLEFGGEKGRIAMAGTVGLLFIIGFLIVKIAELSGIDLLNVINTLPTLSMGMLVVIAVVIAIIIFGISMRISISIMDRKEF